MKKKLFTLLVCAFAWISVNADSWTVSFNEDRTVATVTCTSVGTTNNWSDISYTGLDEGEDGSSLLKAASTLNFYTAPDVEITSLGAIDGGKPFAATTVDFSNAKFRETPSEVKTYDGWDKENKTIVSKTVQTYSNCMTFEIFKNVQNATLANVKTICPGCFKNNAAMTTTFTIPESVTYIATLAVEDTPIKTITIPENVEYIDEKGFQNASIKALIDVTVEGYTAAANGAFDKEITVGQTVGGKEVYAALHFTKEDAVDFFVNKNHELDLETSLDKDLFHVWLGDHYDVASNGWQQFINSTPGRSVPATRPVVLRTFSDNVAHYVPECYRAYIVQGVSGNSTTGYKLTLRETFAIPAHTGVIIYGEAESSFALPILSGSRWYETPYDRNSKAVTDKGKTYDMTNYLVANSTLPSGATIDPYELGSDGTVAERNFVLGSYNSTDMGKASALTKDYIAFYRAKTMKPGTGKAHLKLPSTIYPEPQGYEIIPVNPSSFRESYWTRDYIQYGDWGDKKNSGTDPFLAKSFGEPFEETTGISNVKSENTDDVIYNLQGVKVANSVKGVYVKAGKKIIIK